MEAWLRIAAPEGATMMYESTIKELLLRKAEHALETLKLYHQSFLQPNAIARVRPWETAVEGAFRRTEELRKFVEKELPDYTESLESHGGRLRMEFLRGLNLAERQFGTETVGESVARLIPVLDRTQEGRRLQYFAALAKPLIDLHALKDARDKLDGFTHLEWESAAEKAEVSAAKLATTVKEKLPEFEPAVKGHAGRLGEEIASGLTKVEKIFGTGVASKSSYRLLDALESAF